MNARITVNKDKTITVRVGRNVEHISISSKSHADLFYAVKYAALSKGAIISDIRIAEILTDAYNID